MKKKINILQVVLYMEMGGLENLVLKMSKHINKEKFNVTVLCLYRYDPVYRDELERSSIPVYLIERNGPFDISFFKKIIAFIKEKEIDLVHCHSGCFFNATICSDLAKVKSIFTAHGLPVETGIQARIEDSIAARLSSKIIAVSDEILDVMRKQFSSQKGKVDLLVNGIDTNQFAPAMEADKIRALKESLNIPCDRTIIGAVGRLEEVKNYQMLIRSFAKLMSGPMKDIHLVLMGDGSEREFLEKLALELGVSSYVSFLGVCYELHELVSIIDIFVLSSLTEGTSISLLESQSCGIPAVVTRVGGNERVVKEGYNGFLCKLNDIDEMAGALEKLLTDEDLRKRMGGNARSLVVEKFNMYSMINTYERLYEEFAGAKKCSILCAENVTTETKK